MGLIQYATNRFPSRRASIFPRWSQNTCSFARATTRSQGLERLRARSRCPHRSAPLKRPDLIGSSARARAGARSTLAPTLGPTARAPTQPCRPRCRRPRRRSPCCGLPTLAAIITESNISSPVGPPVKPQPALSREVFPGPTEWACEPRLRRLPRARDRVRRREVYLQITRRPSAAPASSPSWCCPKGRYVMDGELVVFDDDRRRGLRPLLQARLHPAESRVKMLADETPTIFSAFDLLAEGQGEADRGTLLGAGQEEAEKADRQRPRPQEVGERLGRADAADQVGRDRLAVADVRRGRDAKQLDAPYAPGKRKGMVKIKHVRTIDVVIVGWRPVRRRARWAADPRAL